jgi:hypothetical protein
MRFGHSQGQDNCAMTSQPNKMMNFELESGTSSWTIGPQSWMRYHCKAMVFYFYVVSAQYQIKGLHGFSKARQWHHDFTTKQNEFWTWKCHIFMNNRTPKSNEVSLKSYGILLYVVRAQYQIKGLHGFSKAQQHCLNKTNKQEWILNLKVPHLHEQ